VAHPVTSERARRAADVADRVSRAAALLVAVALLVWLAGWYGWRAGSVGVALLGLGWLLHDDGATGPSERDSSP